jgi:hypothetical protein
MRPRAGGRASPRLVGALLLLSSLLASALGPLVPAVGSVAMPGPGARPAVTAPGASAGAAGGRLTVPRPLLGAPPADDGWALAAVAPQEQGSQATLETRQPDVQWSPAGAGR